MLMATFGFTPASEQDFFSAETVQQSCSKSACPLSGEEARQFYETLTKVGDKRQKTSNHGNKQNRESSRRSNRRVPAPKGTQGQTGPSVQRQISRETVGIQRTDMTARQTSNSERTAELQGLRFLRCAHEGDISGLKELLSKGVDINFQDTFFWTAMMCASWCGQRAAVRLLLQQGAAWVGVVDLQGRDAKDLALEAGYKEVLEEFENYERNYHQHMTSEGSAPQAQQCEVCCSKYSSSLSSHLTSTLHQFSLQHPPPTPNYCLPPSSNSYKMMVRCGWTPGTGLGPEGEGPQQPVPTVLKRDHKGLGYGQVKRAKITHFKAQDRDAVKPPSTVWEEKEDKGRKGRRKEESRWKEQKDKNWERDFRASFYL